MVIYERNVELSEGRSKMMSLRTQYEKEAKNQGMQLCGELSFLLYVSVWL